MRRPLTALLPLCLLLLLSACGGDDAPSSAEPSATAARSTASASASASSTTAPATTTATSPPSASGSPSPTTSGGGSLPAFAPITQVFKKDPSAQAPQAELYYVRAASNPGFDRIVFQFNDRIPGYEVKYVDKVQTCARGDTVALAGSKRVVVTFRPATAHDERGAPTVDTPNLESGLQFLRQAKQTCDFEGIVGWGLGLLESRPFRVFELQDPPRIVVDFQQ